MAVLSKARKKLVTKGISQLRDHDMALKHLLNVACIGTTIGPKHVLIFINEPKHFQEPIFQCIDVGANATGDWTPVGARKEMQGIGPSIIVVAIRYKDPIDGLNHSDLMDEVISHCELSGASYLLLDDATTSRWAEASVPMQPLFGIGDISFYSNDQALQDDFEGWCTNSYPYRPPLNFDDVFAQEFVTWIRQTAENQVATSLIAQAAFPSTENGDGGTFDQIESPQDFALMDPSEETIIEETQLDEVDIPGLPLEESERRAKWRAVPQRIRVAIRRLHRQFGHCPKKVLINLLRTAKIDKSYIDAANFHRCNQCEDAQPRRNAHTVSLPERYSFNHALGIDVFESLDARGDKYQVMNLVCLGTCFQLTEIVREGEGLPSSARCLEAIQRRWTCWAGMPTVLRCDRGLHNRGVLAQFCAAHGIQVSHAPLETPEAIGRVERHGGALKAMVRKVVAQTQAVGPSQLQSVLDECCLTKNSMLRHGGYSPSQWVLGKTPRGPPSFMEEDNGSDLGSFEDQVDPESRFALLHKAREEAKKAFMHLDTSKRVQRALLRNAKPLPYTYSIGDVVCFRRDKTGKTEWSTASRVIGFEGTHNESVWVLCQNVPVLVSAQNLRPAQDAEALAQSVLQGEPILPAGLTRGNVWQNFEDLRGVPDGDADEHQVEDADVEPPQEDDDEPSYGLLDGPGPLASIFEDDETEERAERGRSRSPPPTVAARSRRTSVLEPDAERTPSRRSSRNELLDDLPASIRATFEQRRVEEEADLSIRKKLKGFWSNRLSTKEQVEQELKDLPEALKYWNCTPAVRLRIDGSRAKEWKKYEDFQAAIPLKGQQLKELLDAGHTPIPSKWVDTIKNFHERLKPDYDPEFKSRLVSCGNFEDSADVRTDAPTSDLETHALVSAFAASNGVPVESSDIRNAYFQAEPIDRVVLMRQPTGGLPGVDPEAILLIRVPVYGLCDSGRGFWRKVDREARDAGFEVSRIFPAFYFHRHNREVTCVLTTHVDDFLWASKGVGGSIVNKLLEKFEVGRRESGRLRFCGKQFDEVDHDVVIDVTDNTNKIHYIDVKSNRKHSDPIDRGEERQLRSVVGSLSWISRQARPDIMYRVSKLQSSIKGATVATLHEANKVLEIALKGKTLKLRYRNGPFDFENLGVLTASDASFAGESKDRSQQGRIHFLAPANQLTDPRCSEYDVMVVSFSSTTIKRVCRATLQAETYALQSAQESGDRIRAALAELYGNGSRGADWDLRARMRVPHVCLTDCRSLADHLNTETPSRVQDKRLQIELSALRQSVFTEIGDRSCKAYPCGGDRVDWIDTATQAADCLTKSMKPDFIIKVIETGVYRVSRAKL